MHIPELVEKTFEGCNNDELTNPIEEIYALPAMWFFLIAKEN
jgi:hypothetical protein